MRRQFPIFQSHLDQAHSTWDKLLQAGDTVIDATCGNGYDTLRLAQLVLCNGTGWVHAIDVQESAVNATRQRLQEQLTHDQMDRVMLHLQSHAQFPDGIEEGSVRLIVYNLGYLPGGDKGRTTRTDTTLQSLQAAQRLLKAGGMLSVTLYPGHEEGAREAEAVLAALSAWPKQEWSVCQHRWINRPDSPQLLLIQKAQICAQDL
ncbi:MAG: methyltransferase domain-containing protein [Chlamydiia bacterium]|nr:methyltransferase domain-containing protein [Chlamydiia bacterium]